MKKRKTKSFVAFVFLAGMAYNTQAQQSTSAAGETYSNATAVLSWNLGETVIQTYNNAGNHLTQGFEQAEIIVSGINENKNNLQAKAYPNPASASVTLDFSSSETANVQVHDINGRLVIEKTNLLTGSLVDLSSLDQGLYILTLTGEENKQQKIQIQKIH